MPTVTLKAHYDGERIVLDEPFELAVNSSLMITVLPAAPTNPDEERADWARFSATSLARAYSDDEPEYSTADLKDVS